MLTDLSCLQSVSIKTAGCFHPPGALWCFKPLSLHQVLYTLSTTMTVETMEIYKGTFMISFVVTFVLTVPWIVLWAWTVPLLPFLYNIMFCHWCLRHHQMYDTLQFGNFKGKKCFLEWGNIVEICSYMSVCTCTLSLTHSLTHSLIHTRTHAHTPPFMARESRCDDNTCWHTVITSMLNSFFRYFHYKCTLFPFVSLHCFVIFSLKQSPVCCSLYYCDITVMNISTPN
jgi:hypothetical protein